MGNWLGYCSWVAKATYLSCVPRKMDKKRGLCLSVIKTQGLQRWVVSAPSKAAADTEELALNRLHTILMLCLCLEQKCSHLARRCY